MFFHACNHGDCQKDGEETAGRIFLGVNEEVRLDLQVADWMIFILRLDIGYGRRSGLNGFKGMESILCPKSNCSY